MINPAEVSGLRRLWWLLLNVHRKTCATDPLPDVTAGQVQLAAHQAELSSTVQRLGEAVESLHASRHDMAVIPILRDRVGG